MVLVLPNSLRKVNNAYGYHDFYEQSASYYDYDYVPQIKKVKLKNKKTAPKKAKRNLIACFFALALLGLYGYYVCPYNYQNYLKPLFVNRFLNRNLDLNVSDYINPTTKYLHNSYFLGDYQLSPYAEKSKQISKIKIISEMTGTKQKLLKLFEGYSKLEPSVFVWEYSTGYGFEINADKIYPAASIIKIPLVYELIRKIDYSSKTNNPITLQDKRQYTEQFKTLGSGDLQYTKTNVFYSLDYLANITIANSDNSATNMLLYEIGGVDGFNRAMRSLGLKTISMNEWLPDLDGENKISAREISEVLYNLDNPNYINPKYKSIIKEYLGNTRNIHLLKEKLPQSAMVLHKTGNIANMIGDSGVIYTDNGKKYIVTILVKRPKNDFGAKVLIQDASEIIYNDIKAL